MMLGKCIDIAESNEVVYIKRPVFENKKIIINLGKSYVKSNILFDSTDKFYGFMQNKKVDDKRLSDFPDELKLGSVFSERPVREFEKPVRKVEQQQEKNIGYCIRSGVEIKFNPKQPMSRASWRIWNEYGNVDFPEKYCHKSGKWSNGKTSMRKPIL